jgi:hypothetical protein
VQFQNESGAVPNATFLTQGASSQTGVLRVFFIAKQWKSATKNKNFWRRKIVNLPTSLLIGSVIFLAPQAHAQSKITLYGLIDSGINFVNNAQSSDPTAPNGRSKATQVQETSGVLRSNRWGIAGREEIGNGYAVVFTLEDGFDLGTGRFQQGGALFGRQAFVGIDSSWGKLTLGRQYDLFTENLGPMQGSLPTSAFADHPGDIDNLANNFRVNNAVKYVSPKYAGFSYGAMYGLGGVAAILIRIASFPSVHLTITARLVQLLGISMYKILINRGGEISPPDHLRRTIWIPSMALLPTQSCQVSPLRNDM